MSIELTDADWISFENTFCIEKTSLIEVKNLFRHMCRMFITTSNIELWNKKTTNWDKYSDIHIEYFHITKDKKWVRKLLKGN